MKKNQYHISLRNNQRYNLNNYDNNYKNDISFENLKKENKYNSLLQKRKTPFILTPKLMLNNNNNSIKINPSKSLDLSNNNKYSRDNNDDNRTNTSNYILKDEYINMDEDNVNISTLHWKYDGPTGLNTEKKHFPTKLNIGNYFKTKTNEDENHFPSSIK